MSNEIEEAVDACSAIVLNTITEILKGNIAFLAGTVHGLKAKHSGDPTSITQADFTKIENAVQEVKNAAAMLP